MFASMVKQKKSNGQWTTFSRQKLSDRVRESQVTYNFCFYLREKRAELDAEAAERLFTQSRAKSLQNKIIDLQVEEHLLKMVRTQAWISVISTYSETGLKRPLKKDTKNPFSRLIIA